MAITILTNSRLSEDSPVLEPSSSPNEHLPLLVLGCWARGVLLSVLYLVRSASLATYLKDRTDRLFLKGILEQYRPTLEILGLLHGADGGGIIHCQTSRSESESF